MYLEITGVAEQKFLYQEMKLNMPEKVTEMALKDGYYALSLEVLPEFAGDYVIFSKESRYKIIHSKKQMCIKIFLLFKIIKYLK